MAFKLHLLYLLNNFTSKFYDISNAKLIIIIVNIVKVIVAAYYQCILVARQNFYNVDNR